MSKDSHWATGKASFLRKGRSLLCKGTSQKTYEMVLLPFAIYRRTDCRGKPAAVHLCAVVFLFLGGFL